MKAPGIGGALALSFFLHLAIITLAFYFGRSFYARKQATPYFVTLVSPSRTTGAGEVSAPSPAPKIAPHEPVKPAEKNKVERYASSREKAREETSLIKERIEALRAKQKIEKLAKLRKIIDMGTPQRPQTTSQSGPSANSKTAGGSSSSGSDYSSLIQAKIHEQYRCPPDIFDKDLESIVSVRIAKDGTITIENWEKKSGNPLFDRCVLRTLKMSSPLPPPPKEMEIGIRFSPQEM
jgi:outer membrane biosynthesis protein TonB